jgi:hypothetical protein
MKMTIEGIAERNDFTKAVHSTMAMPPEIEVEHCEVVDFLLSELKRRDEALDVIENLRKEYVYYGTETVRASDTVKGFEEALKIAGRETK